MINVQCKRRWHNLVCGGKVKMDKAKYMAIYCTPDPSYIYDADTEKAFHNQKKKGQRESRVWSNEIVRPLSVIYVYEHSMIECVTITQYRMLYWRNQ